MTAMERLQLVCKSRFGVVHLPMLFNSECASMFSGAKQELSGAKQELFVEGAEMPINGCLGQK